MTIIKSARIVPCSRICSCIALYRVALFTLVLLLLTSGQQGLAQNASPGSDLPTQRWLPMPGSGSDAPPQMQIEALQTLQRMLDQKRRELLPPMSEDQLQGLEDTFQKWKRRTGAEDLPDLASIPDEWINQAVKNPDLRKRVQRLLESYARDRKLPRPGSGPSAPAIPQPEVPGITSNPETAPNPPAPNNSPRSQDNSPRLRPQQTPRSPVENSASGNFGPLPQDSENRQQNSLERSSTARNDSPLAENSRSDASQAARKNTPLPRSTVPSRENPAGSPPSALNTDRTDDLPDESIFSSQPSPPSSTSESRPTRPQASEFPQEEASQVSRTTQDGSRRPPPQTESQRSPQADYRFEPRAEVDPDRFGPSRSENPFSGENSADRMTGDSNPSPFRPDASGRSSNARRTGVPGSQSQPRELDYETASRTNSRGGNSELPDPERLKELMDLLNMLARQETGGVGPPTQSANQNPPEFRYPSNREPTDRSRSGQSLNEERMNRYRSSPNFNRPDRNRNDSRNDFTRRESSSNPFRPADPSSLSDPDEAFSNSRSTSRSGAAPQGISDRDREQLKNSLREIEDQFAEANSSGSHFELKGREAQDSAPGADSAAREKLQQLLGDQSRSIANKLRQRGSGTAPESGRKAAGAASQSGKSTLDRLVENVDPDTVKKLIERRGFGETLKQIVETTLEKEKSPKSPTPFGQDANEVDSSEFSASLKKTIERLTGQKPADTGGSTTFDKKSSASPPPTSLASSGQDSSQSEKGLSGMFSNLMKSVRESPKQAGSAPSSSSSSSDSIANNVSLPQFSFTFGWPQIVALLVIMGALALLWQLRHYVRILDPEAAERRWVAKVLKAGVKTREDVIRAYHSLVLRSSNSVATWWTHRRVAQQLSEEISPQLRELLQEITNIYEEARYLPPERELNSDQIRCMESAIRQFEAAGA